MEQDIVNIQTAFTVGTEPKMDCTPDESEKGIFEALKQVLKKNKIRYQNRKVVRYWLSEQECAEYWYVTIDVDVEVVPYMIDSIDDKVTTAVAAVAGGIWSRREGIVFAGNMDRIGEELKEIEEEQATKNTEILKKGQRKAA